MKRAFSSLELEEHPAAKTTRLSPLIEDKGIIVHIFSFINGIEFLSPIMKPIKEKYTSTLIQWLFYKCIKPPSPPSLNHSSKHTFEYAPRFHCLLLSKKHTSKLRKHITESPVLRAIIPVFKCTLETSLPLRNLLRSNTMPMLTVIIDKDIPNTLQEELKQFKSNITLKFCEQVATKVASFLSMNASWIKQKANIKLVIKLPADVGNVLELISAVQLYSPTQLVISRMDQFQSDLLKDYYTGLILQQRRLLNAYTRPIKYSNCTSLLFELLPVADVAEENVIMSIQNCFFILEPFNIVHFDNLTHVTVQHVRNVEQMLWYLSFSQSVTHLKFKSCTLSPEKTSNEQFADLLLKYDTITFENCTFTNCEVVKQLVLHDTVMFLHDCSFNTASLHAMNEFKEYCDYMGYEWSFKVLKTVI